MPTGGDPVQGAFRALTWSVRVDGPLGPADNMAVDHALVDCVGPRAAVLRFYTWTEPTVSLGRHEPARDRWRQAARSGLACVRRPTGGRAVLHDRELTYSVVVGRASGVRPRAAYQWVQGVLTAGIRALGVRAEQATDQGDRDRPTSGAACFATSAAGEIQVRGRKLVGSAQARMDGVLLQHGAILMANDQADLATLSGDERLAVQAATLEGLGDVVSPERLASTLQSAFEEDLGARLPPFVPDACFQLQRELRRTHYEDEAWTWRR